MNSTSSNNNMPHQQKKRRLDDGHIDYEDHLVTTFDALSTDELARIFEYLSPENIMLARLNKKMRDAATITVVPMNSDIDNAFYVNSVRKYNAFAAMAMALPNLQQIKIGSLSEYVGPNTHKYNDGEDPNNDTVIITANQATHDIGILSNFTRLCELRIHGAPLNGRYPMLFNFPLLQKLHISDTYDLKWDLEMLTGLTFLEVLICENGIVTGTIDILRVLKDTLSEIDARNCRGVRGNLMDLADFPKLKYLTLEDCGVTIDFEEISKDAFPALETLTIFSIRNVFGNFMNLSDLPHLKDLCVRNTQVTGDIRDIGSDDFPSLEFLYLPSGVYGGDGYKLQRISDAPDVIAAVSTLLKQRPNLQMEDWYAELSDDSPERYEPVDYVSDVLPFPPLRIEFVKAGSRLGWRWTDYGHPCEINWLDPEPRKESDSHKEYVQELAEIEKELDAYKGYYDFPPNEDEYHDLYSEYKIRYAIV